MSPSLPKVAIVGGGPGGLTAGLLLHKLGGIDITIFELRHKPSAEELAKPSGMLDLHEESGIAAIKECGLLDQFLKLTGECSEADKVADKHGNILHQDDGEGSNRPEISRNNLTKLLIDHIPAHRVKWGHKLLSATSSTDSGHSEVELDFGPQGKHTCDLVIGADGAWSKIRKLRTDAKPYYDGRQLIALTIRNMTKKYPHLAELVGSGTFAALGNRHGIMSQRGPQDSARIYVFLTTKEEHFTAAKEQILSDENLLGSFGAILKELVSVAWQEEEADNPGADILIRPMYVLPGGYAWEHKTGATLIGDAAHLMAPVGEGVNLAMGDALLLIRAIAKAQESAGNDADAVSFQRALDPLVKDFEVDMTKRADEASEGSVQITQMMFGEDGAKKMADFFSSFGGPAPPE